MVENKKSKMTLFLAAGVVGALIFLVVEGVNLDFWKDKLRFLAGKNMQAELVSRPPVSRSISGLGPEAFSKGETVNKQEKTVTLNEQGVALVQKKKLWEGMYCFEQAIRENPSEIIPLINMIVVLTDLGFTKPAERYVALARKIDPDHPLLQAALSTQTQKYDRDGVTAADTLNTKWLPESWVQELQRMGTRPWGEDMLMLWGIDDSTLY